MRQKGFIHILLLIVLLTGLVAGVYLVTSGNPLKLFSKAFDKKSASITTELPHRGYIIQFKDLPAVGRMAAESYEQSLQSTHEVAKKDIFNRLSSLTQGSSQIKILGEYTKSFNGLALDITDQQAQSLISSSYVKRVYANLQVKTNLTDSVPLIGADKVWQQKDIQGRNITGEGVRVGVIDTGVDYTHPDLGQSNIIERNFQQIVASNLWPRVLYVNENNLVYHLDHAIYIYNFQTGESKSISVKTPVTLWVRKGVFEDNILAYYAIDEDYNAALYYYDFNKKIQGKIIDTQGVGEIAVSGGKIYYGRLTRASMDSPGPYFYSFDINTKVETPLTASVFTESFESIMSQVSGNKIAASYKGLRDNCPSKIVIYDLNSGISTDHQPAEVGFVMDFKDDQILYAACDNSKRLQDWSVYYLYNIATSETTRISYTNVTTGTTVMVNRFRNFQDQDHKISPQAIFFAEFEYGAWGNIGSEVVYFTQDWRRTHLIGYDLVLNRYSQVNLLRLPQLLIKAHNKKICFTAEDYTLYCHDYDSRNSYDLPETIFNNKIVDGFNFIDNNSNPLDDRGHGTHVAATVAGNGVLKGVAPAAKIVAYKVFDNWGNAYSSDIIAALEKAVSTRMDAVSDNNIDVLNMSLGANCYSGYTVHCGPDDAMSQAVDNTVDAGIVVVIAAGNSGSNASTIGSPGTARKAITVGAVDKNKKIASFSSRGPVIWNDENVNKPDIVAPGVSICAAEWDSSHLDGRCIDNKHIAITGTSMATPHVAGLVALIKQANPNLTPQQIKDILKSTAVNLSGYDQNTQGSGLVDAEAAIKSILEPGPPSLGNRACVQVITPARRESTGECRDFPTPCDVPPGWVKVSSCGVSDDISSPSPSPFSKLTPGGRATPPQTPTPQPTSSSQTISLSAGNNFIGLTVDKGSGYRAANLASDLNSAQVGTVTQISEWYAGSWQTYIVNFPANDFFDIQVGEGYLVKASRYAQVNLSGAKATLATLTIRPGYNSISFPEIPSSINTAEKLVNEMRTQGINITTLSRWKDGAWRSYIPGFPAGSFEIKPGEGYYLKSFANENKTFNIPTSSSSVSAQVAKPSFSCTPCLADVNQDKRINVSDVSLWSYCRIRGINSSPRCINADLDKDGKVAGDIELRCITSQFGKKCFN